MRPSLPVENVPLTEVEKKNLIFLYNRQLRRMAGVFCIILACALFLCMLAWCIDLAAAHFQHLPINYGSTLLRRLGNFCFLAVIIIGVWGYFYWKRVLVYRQDAESGIKNKLTFTISNKEYFPLTNQFFVHYYGSIEDPAAVQRETDQDTWNACFEGGYFSVYRAARSKYELWENAPLMEAIRPTETVPLTDNEKDFLLYVFKKRRRFLVIVYSVMITFACVICLSAYGMDTLRNMLLATGAYKYPATLPMRLGNLAFILCFLIPSFIYFYNRYVASIRRDIASGVKEKTGYVIVRKEFFPLTDKYYVAFDDPAYLHHEIDQETWYNSYEGGYFFVYRAIKSRVVFEESGKFSLI